MAIVLKDNTRLYLRTWEYNVAQVMTKLAEIVSKEGGRVSPINTAIISDRNDDEQKTPITVTHTSYISFTHGGFYYYYQIDDNPFFDFYYKKTEIRDGKYSKDACLTNDKKEWLTDHLFKKQCKQIHITQAARAIFEMLTNAEKTEIIRESCKLQIPNTHNDGYHTEVVEKQERFGEIDF